jgi:hypothetical protein
MISNVHYIRTDGIGEQNSRKVYCLIVTEESIVKTNMTFTKKFM